MNITPVFATNITGVEAGNGVYNIDAAKVSGDTGFRQYEYFTLDSGDVANLKFDQGYHKFVNLVDNQVNINGIVNTTKGDAFFGGHAIFVSPNGIVVGASGVLNVGALTLATPVSDKYDALKTAYKDNNLNTYVYGSDKYKELLSSSAGTITINGRVMAKEGVEIYGKNITIEGKNGDRAGIVAGAKEQEKIITQQKAKEVFDSLGANNIKNADNFSLEGGKIKIVAKSESKKGDAGGNIKASVAVKKADIGANKTDISSTADVERQERIDLAEANVDIEDSNITEIHENCCKKTGLLFRKMRNRQVI